jgi:hypothetical protein
MGHGQQLYGLQRMACEASIAGLNRAKQVLTQVYLAALEHSERIGPANRLDQLDLHVGVTLRVLVQELDSIGHGLA